MFKRHISVEMIEQVRRFAHEAEDWFCVYQCAKNIDQARNALEMARACLTQQLLVIDALVPVRCDNAWDHTAAELILRRERNKNSLRLYNKGDKGLDHA